MIGGRVQRFLAVLASWFGTARVEAIMTPEEFTRAFVAKMEELHPNAQVRAEGALKLSITWNSSVVRIHLDNVYKLHVSEPENADTIISHYINSLAGSFDKSLGPTIEQLVPVIQTDEFLNSDTGELVSDQNSVPSRLLAGELHVVYAFDTPFAVKYVERERLGEILDEPEFETIAKDNLRRIMVQPTIEAYPTFATVSAGDSYGASLLLIDEFWSADEFRFRGDIVVFVVARDLLLVTGSEENEGVEAAMKIAHNMIGQVAYAISASPIVRRDGKWQSFVQ